MLVALDVGYQVNGASETGRCGIVAFEDWLSSEPLHELVAEVPDVKDYVPGRLFERELPCLIAGLEALSSALPGRDLAAVLVDGNVRLDAQGRPGLGMHLFRHLGEGVPVIGVAKSPFQGLDAVEVRRGSSARPLYVTAAGITESKAAALVRSMAGDARLPTLIRRADQLTRR